jgi:hypothetical protein
MGSILVGIKKQLIILKILIMLLLNMINIKQQQRLKTNPKTPIGSPTIGFLPFDLTLTIDGLSGMKVYQKYTIDTDFLPSNYPLSLEFLIKGITHTIQNNQWITTLESVAIPKNPFGMKNAQGQTYNGSPATSGGRPVGVAATTGQAPRGNNFTPSTGRPPQNSPLLYKAVQQQAAWFFSANPPKPGECARYVYNIAYNLKKHIDTNSQQAITFNNGSKAQPMLINL